MNLTFNLSGTQSTVVIKHKQFAYPESFLDRVSSEPHMHNTYINMVLDHIVVIMES